MIFLNIVQKILYKIKSKFPSAKNSISMYKTGNSILSFLTFFWHIMSKNKLMMKVCLHCKITISSSQFLIQFYKICLKPRRSSLQGFNIYKKHLWFNIVVNNPILQKRNGKLYIYKTMFLSLHYLKRPCTEKNQSQIFEF